MEEAVSKLLTKETNFDHPGMLLGLIQSGKTRAFIGIMALAFDKGYEVCVVLTKNSTALVSQTVKRINSEFFDPIQGDAMLVYDIMNVPPLTNYNLSKKIVFVVKKEDKNLKRLHTLFVKTHRTLKDKKVLIIDDEADASTITYYRDKESEDGLRIGQLAKHISDFRKELSSKSDFLQVTATPYSLYLQPQNITVNAEGYAPLKPAFTVVLTAHKAYVGGKLYFEDSEDDKSFASHIFQPVAPEEFNCLIKSNSRTRRNPDDRLRQNILTTPKLSGFRTAIIDYIVAGSIRSLQEKEKSEKVMWAKQYKSACLVHIHTKKDSHRWQAEIIETLLADMGSLKNNEISELLDKSIDGFKESVNKSSQAFPTKSKIINRVQEAFANGEISVKEVNSENEVINLLDDNGQLRLDNPFNIFVGGQALDRGITIDNLISFFYGRSPGRFQMDTVLQHSRMYGARSEADLAVTRLYTSQRIYLAMKDMHYFDNALREACLKGEKVRFIQRGTGGDIIPCSPNKTANSELQIISPHSRHLPIGFQTIAATQLQKITTKIDNWVSEQCPKNPENGWKSSLDNVIEILELIRDSFTYESRFENEDLKWDFESYIDKLKYACGAGRSVTLMFRDDRNVSRLKNDGGAFTDAPDDGRNDLRPARKAAVNQPVILLLRQNGLERNGWRDCSFYWPVMISPTNMQTSVYSEDKE